MKLNDTHLKKDPYVIPADYTDSIEERVSNAIYAEEHKAPTIILWLKPAFMLASMFLIIGSLGYIASNITAKFTSKELQSEQDIFALIEEGYLKSSFIYSYYDDIDVKTSFEQSVENNIKQERINDLLENTISPQEFLYYIEQEDND